MPQEKACALPLGRPLTDDERQLLTWLLEHGEPGASEYLAQIPSVTVVGQCSCGCPTLDLAVAGKRGGTASTLVADFLGTSPEGAYVGVIVHVREGMLSELEAYSLSDIKTFSLPRSGQLRPAWQDRGFTI